MGGQGEALVNILPHKWSERVCQKFQPCMLSRMSATQINYSTTGEHHKYSKGNVIYNVYKKSLKLRVNVFFFFLRY